MQRIFITGICGFVGSNLALYFQSIGNKVYGIDNFSRKGSKKNLNLLKKKGIKVFKGDLINFKKNKIFKKNINFDALVHCAALTSVLDGVNNNSSEFLYKNNILSTLESLKLCHFLKSKFIYISSSRVYSISEINKLKLQIRDNSFKLTQNSTIGISLKGISEEFSTKPPLSMYGSSKLVCENIIQEYCLFYRIPFVINRCGLLSGSGQLYKNDQGIISYWINSWKKEKKLNYIGFNGKGMQVRDCLHPLDLSKLIKKQINFLEKKKLKSFIFNVSGGISSSFSLKELSIWCEKKIFSKKIGHNKKNRPFDLKWIVLDNTKTKKIFKWKPEFLKYDIFQDINSNDY
jgi:CDP-paratose 2-epimerase